MTRTQRHPLLPKNPQVVAKEASSPTDGMSGGHGGSPKTRLSLRVSKNSTRNCSPQKLIRPKQDGYPVKGELDKGQEKDKTEHVSTQYKNENHWANQEPISTKANYLEA